MTVPEEEVPKYYWEFRYSDPMNSKQTAYFDKPTLLEYTKQQMMKGIKIPEQFRQFGMKAEEQLLREELPIGGESRNKWIRPNQKQYDRYWTICYSEKEEQEQIWTELNQEKENPQKNDRRKKTGLKTYDIVYDETILRI